MTNAIHVKDLKKTFKTHKREHGLLNAVKSLVKRQYKIKHALKGVSFDIEEGEIVGFIGPNGAGKSTTIKALSGVLYPSSGVVNVLGYTPWRDRVKYVANIGVVFGQKPQLHWDLPPLDTYWLNKEVYDIPRKEFEKRLKYMIKLLDVEEIVQTPVRDLSLGERMKCKIIAALLHNPKLVFLDEPSIGLDVVAKDTLRDFILDVNKRFKTTFIVTTHDMGDIERLCQRIIIINNGIIVYDGPIAKIKKDYLTHKHLDVKFNKLDKKFRFKGCKVMEQSDYELKLELDTKKQKVKNVVNHLITEFDVADIIVQDPPIEEIIQKIYKEKKK
ncbi:ATP-binding cassette domain-containing protein [Candidatus Woesearchaeota archaeon]|nr:ATP-binding cassette domain-containing protein [Candidatus Woesearchaeota archaeon]MBW3005576.1 ATP-binding cassette domain-containing protein [Candidatus Woesearchaeota archaeon]